MPNTITDLIPTIYKALETVSRELVGFIPSVFMNAAADQVKVGQNIRYPVTPAMSASNITPAATGPAPGDQTIASEVMSITKARGVPFYWEGEEQKGLNTANLYDSLLQAQFEQAMRTLVNELEADLAALYVSASRAYGTAGTTPFGTNLAEAAQVRKILADNGAPLSQLQLVINTTAGAALRTLAQLTKVNEAGSDQPLRRGVLLDVFGFQIRESAQVKNHTKGTGSGYKINGTPGVGATTIPVDTGTGTIIPGDILTITSDTNKYVTAVALSGGNVVINKPGLLAAAADNADVALGNNYAANLAFDRNAIHALVRVPAMPEGGDSASDVTAVTDPVSGISFQIAMYRQYRRIAFEVGLAWGVKAVKPEHIAILLG